jgi:NAD(P)-dependent dehydrogenase (short-subunit alcohol dehydrogenase family)
VRTELDLADGTVSTHRLDVTDRGSIQETIDAVVARHGHLDILLNNAGTKVPQSVLDVTEDAWDEVLGTNLKGAFFCAQAAARVMVERGRGKIINVASTYAVVGAANRATYAASKGGLLQLTRVMAIELAGRGVNVNAIGPTATNTPMNASLFESDAWRSDALARIPAGRFAVPEDVAGAVVFLASAASDMVNGHLLLIDGGFTAL